MRLVVKHNLHGFVYRLKWKVNSQFIGNRNIQSGPKKCIHSLLTNIFGINLNEISISG